MPQWHQMALIVVDIGLCDGHTAVLWLITSHLRWIYIMELHEYCLQDLIYMFM